jgi:hypothetical protein
MGPGKKKQQRAAAAKANNRKHRSGEKPNQRRNKSESDREHIDDLADTPTSDQSANGPRTRSTVASTRKQLFKKKHKQHNHNDYSDESERNHNSDMDTTDEDTRKNRAKVGRVETVEDSASEEQQEIIFVADDSDDTDELLDRNNALNKHKANDEDSEESHDYTRIIHADDDTDEDKATQHKKHNQKRKDKATAKKKVVLNTPKPTVENEVEMTSPPPSPTTLEEPTATDITKECRYSVTITIPPSTEPWKAFTDTLKKFLKLIHEQVHNKIYIATWDPEFEDTEKIIKKPGDFPEGAAKNRKHYANYFSGYPNPKKNKSSRIYLKVRFLAPEPDLLPFNLAEMGQELSDSIAEEIPDIYFSRHPYACQAVRPECIGWFFGSTKSIDSTKLVPAIREKLKIPHYVQIGVQWRTIKDENRKNYEWKADLHPPQALHLDMDQTHAGRYTEPAARLWKKGATNRVNGLQLRMIPCLGSNQAIALSDNQRSNVVLMAAKQQYFTNSYIVKIENAHIMNLDAIVNGMTLRKYIMSRAPKTSVIQRLFVSVDKSWRGNDFTLVTVKPYAGEAIKALNCMIPECLHYYGEEATKVWFSNAGLLAYQNVKWDPDKQSTTSHQDSTTKALVDEDLFHIGSNWKMEAPIIQPEATRDQRQQQQKIYTVENVLESRTTDNDVRSFGSVFGRNHDGDSIETEKNSDTAEESTRTIIQIDPNLEITDKGDKDDMSFDASSAGFTTGTTRAKLRNQTEINTDLLKENQALAALLNEQSDDHSVKTTKSTTDKLAEALQQIALMKAQEATSKEARQIISPELKRQAPVNHEPTDTETDSVGGKN